MASISPFSRTMANKLNLISWVPYPYNLLGKKTPDLGVFFILSLGIGSTAVQSLICYPSFLKSLILS